MHQEPLLLTIARVMPALHAIHNAGGIAYLVGGSVRDFFMQKPLFDIDIEVHQLTEEQLVDCLQKQAPIHFVGKKFGVFRIGSIDIDWSLPRTDSLGRKPIVTIDPFMGIEAACKRRDLSMNSMAIRLTENEKETYGISIENIIDPFGGIDTIKKNELSLIDAELFVQDPLRLYRVIQYISRFEMNPDNQLTETAKKMSLVDPITNKPIASERIGKELKKMFILSDKPARGLRWLMSINRLEDLFPDLALLQKQKSLFSTKNSLDATLDYIDQLAPIKKNYADLFSEQINDETYFKLMLILFFAEQNTASKNKKTDLLATYNSGLTNKQIQSFLTITIALAEKTDDIDYQQKITAYQLAPHWRLLDALIIMHILYPDQDLTSLIKRAEKNNILYEPIKPLLTGSYFVAQGLTDQAIGKALEHAYLLQIKENITTVERLKQKLK
jgi:tRNA nucleotidyltransferase/poly(A) polymerase